MASSATSLGVPNLRIGTLSLGIVSATSRIKGVTIVLGQIQFIFIPWAAYAEDKIIRNKKLKKRGIKY